MPSNLVVPSRPWATPTPDDDDNDWDSADGGVSTSRRRKEKNLGSPSHQTAMQQAEVRPSKRDSSRSPGDHVPPVRVVTPSKPRAAFGSPEKRTPSTVESADSYSGAIPTSYVHVITAAFGPAADLYEHVLEIPRTSSPRDTRIAYFRRGRQVLAENQDTRRHTASSSVGGSVSEIAKLRFQAISMAYEILSNPTWREAYDTNGLKTEDVSINVIHVTKSESTTPLLRRSSSLDAFNRRSGNAVRWNEEVEELLYSQDPSELGSPSEDENDDEGEPPSSNAQRGRKKKRTRKKRTVIEVDELKTHLETLDRQAERHFVADFLDDLEASIEGLLSLGSMNSKSFEQEDDDEETRNPDERGRRAHKQAPDKVYSKIPNRNQSGQRSLATDDLEKPSPVSISRRQRNERLRKSQIENNAGNGKGDLTARQLSYEFPNIEFPNIVLEQKSACKVNEDSNSTVITSDSLSTLSASIVDKKFAMNTSTGMRSPSLDRLPEEGNVLNTSEDAINGDVSTGSQSSIVLKSSMDTHSVATLEEPFDIEHDACEVIEAVGSWCAIEDIEDSSGIRATVQAANRASLDRNEEVQSPILSIDTGDDQDGSQQGENLKSDHTQEDFRIHLMAYLNSFTVLLSEVGATLIPTSLQETIMLSEEDLDGMLGILRSEMENIPDDFDGLEEFEELL